MEVGDAHGVQRCRVGVTESDVPEPLEPGAEVWFDGYGNGVVETVDEIRMSIRWEKAGLLYHDLSFVRHLKPPVRPGPT